MGPTTERRIQQAFQSLVTSGDSGSAVALSHELLASNPGLHPAIVLAAQVNMIDRDFEAALEKLHPVVGELPEYTSGWLLYGRLNEKLDDVVGALVSYTRIADSSSTAAARARELKTRGAEILRNRIESDLNNGRTDDAIRSLERLQSVAGDEKATLQATAWVARASNDPELELDAVRTLHSQNPGDREVTERRAELEMEVGDPSNGMRLMKELVTAYPGDKLIEEKAARAEFLWRLQLLPPDVQAMAQEPQVDRGDFATLVFWLFPEVRYGRAGSARIANDILEHPHRSEIVRVINLGLMDVDPSLHRFEPYRPILRIEALSSMTRLLADQRPPPVCVGPGSAQVDSSRQRICQLASQCGLIASESDCLPSATIAGPEVVDLARSSQELVANR
jgi:tetratricopeptide (TPR) repeat protein